MRPNLAAAARFWVVTWMVVITAGTGCFLKSLDAPEPPIPAGWTFPYGWAGAVAWRRYNKLVQGTVLKVEANWDDDAPCGIFAGLKHRCDGTRAYKVVIQRVDGGKEHVMVFVKHDDFNPITVGLTGTFLLTMRFIVPLHRCREVAAQYGDDAACATLGRPELVILSTDDVLPLDIQLSQ